MAFSSPRRRAPLLLVLSILVSLLTEAATAFQSYGDVRQRPTFFTGRTAASRSLSQSNTVRRSPFLPPTHRFAAEFNDGNHNNNNIISNSDGNILIVDPLILELSKTLQRVSFFSWWSQVILSTVSAVILGFAKNVMMSNAQLLNGPNLLFSGPGLLLSAGSILWTWGNGSRLSRRIVSKPTSRSDAAVMLRRAIQVGATVNMIGLLFNLLAAEEIVGRLAVKVLSQQAQTGAAWSAGLQGLQPLDILVVQANTNSIFSHFLSLASLLFMTKKVHKLRGDVADAGVGK
jgi:hypothetical protein